LPESNNPSKRLRAVIIGCGRIAGGYSEADDGARPITHVAAARIAKIDIVGCCDVDPDRARAFAARWRVPDADTDLERLLERSAPDLGIVCTPPTVRVPVVNALLAASSVRGMLIEKPLAASGAEADTLAAALRHWGRPVAVNFFRAFDPFYRNLEEIVKRGTLGPCREAVVRYYGGALENASHLVERLVAMFSIPREARRLGGSDLAPLFELQWAETRGLFLPTENVDASPLEIDLWCAKGRIRVLDSEQRAEQFVASPDPVFPGVQTLRACEAVGAPDSTGSFSEVLPAIAAWCATGRIEVETLDRAVATAHIMERAGMWKG
jgi:hypothetical protein